MVSAKKRAFDAKLRRKYPRRTGYIKKVSTTMLKKLPVILPDRYKCKLIYGDTYALDPSAAVPAVQVFGANSLYDPDATGVGHQPRGFDQLCLFYNHFIVEKSYIKVQYLPLGTANSLPCMWGVMLTANGSTTGAYTAKDVLEAEHIRKWRLAGSLQTLGNKSQNILTHKFDAKKFFNIAGKVDGSEYKCTATGGPTELAYFELFTLSPDGTVNPDPAFFAVEIVYTLTCHEPKQVAGS